ncbi:uncharacterized protein [Clytia hemisphaerica]|uniref:Ig-like domain-containing protein n=1 Tax=Clytia hemisphaerica TaxID=252671 RepID=A0A7M5XEW1_9CNID
MSSLLQRYERKKVVFSTPDYPNAYPPLKKCGWIINHSPNDADININFHDFELEKFPRCYKSDYMTIYRDQGTGKWEQIGSMSGYCGELPNFLISTSARQILVKFTSDLTKNYRGFNASFTSNVHLPPNITYIGDLLRQQTEDGVLTVEDKQTIQLQCDAQKSSPYPSYIWEKLNTTIGLYQPIRKALVKFERSNGSICLTDIRMMDGGTYRCTAQTAYGTDTETLYVNVTKSCPCPREIRAAWMFYPPYTNTKDVITRDGRPVQKNGIFEEYLQKMVKEVCTGCTKLIWDTSNFKERFSQLEKGIMNSELSNSTADIFFPVQGSSGGSTGGPVTRYKLKYYYLPIMNSPSILHYTSKESSHDKDILWKSISSAWPIVISCVILAVLAGIVIWALETYWNEEQFPREFSSGIVEGFWWAIISMTTVGYGDIAPVSVPGRLFAVFWILTGLIIVAIFTSVLSTSLSVQVLTSEVKLYGSRAGAISNTYESRLGYLKGAIMQDFQTVDEMDSALSDKQVDGLLVDSFIAGHHFKQIFQKHRISKNFQPKKTYGFVFGRQLSTSVFYQRFLNFHEQHMEFATDLVANKTHSPEMEDQSSAMESADQIISNESEMFKTAVRISGIALGSLIVVGLFFEYCYLRPRHRMIQSAKRTELCQSKAVKEMIFRSNLLKSTLVREVAHFRKRWDIKLNYVKRRHTIEVKKMKTKLARPRVTAAPQEENSTTVIVQPSAPSSSIENSESRC